MASITAVDVNPARSEMLIRIENTRPILAAKIFGALSIGCSPSLNCLTTLPEIQLSGLYLAFVKALK